MTTTDCRRSVETAMDKSNESAEEDATSPKSNGKVLVNGVTKDRQGVMQSFRKSFRKAKGSKVTGKAESAENEPGRVRLRRPCAVFA
ncbi:hypothetical protein INR49_018780 [Caranx melampygus]|nr:hypothetical protein INR49_018780 [Caranx melampygus]